jgi:hypothetical protein
MLVRHRKSVHGYQPYHSPSYLTKKALKEAEKELNKANLSKTSNKQAASVVPHSSICDLSSKATYHDDSRKKMLVDVPRRRGSQGVQISIPISLAPALDAPKKTSLFLDSGIPLPNIGQQQLSTSQERDGTDLLDDLQSATTAQPALDAPKKKSLFLDSGLPLPNAGQQQQLSTSQKRDGTDLLDDLQSDTTVQPALDAPKKKSLFLDSGLPLSNVGQQLSTSQKKRDGTDLLGLQSDTTVQPQSQASAQWRTASWWPQPLWWH